MSILDKWLNKKGIISPNELTEDEKKTYDNYKAVLSGENISVDKIKEFCHNQVKLIETKFANNPRTDDDIYLKACLHVYLNIIKCIEVPQVERERVEKYLLSIINE